MNVCLQGFSESGGEATPCESAKRTIERKIMGIDLYEQYSGHQHDEIQGRSVRTTNQNELLDHVENNESLLPLITWLKDIKEQADITVADSDNGDRDNLMYNLKFVKHFMRLCKLLPLWSGISCRMFASPSVTSSSANVESYFNDMKRNMKDVIPCPADVFVQSHMDGTDDAIITASRRYATAIVPIVTQPIEKTAEKVLDNDLDIGSFDLHQFLQENDPFIDENTDAPSSNCEATAEKNKTIYTCIACNDGNLPDGGHTCIECGKNVHILDGCSVDIGSEEGYGAKRLCMKCHKRKETQTQETVEMQYKEQWGKRPKSKQSKYMQANPLFDIMSDVKKQAIGLLKNGNQYTKPFYVDKKPVHLYNTCGPDATAQTIAGAYAYYPQIRSFYDKQSDPIVQIAICLAKK